MSKKNLLYFAISILFLFILAFVYALLTKDSNDNLNQWINNHSIEMISSFLSLLTIIIVIVQLNYQFEEINVSKKPKVAISKTLINEQHDFEIFFKNYSNNPAYNININFNEYFISQYSNSMIIYYNTELLRLDNILNANIEEVIELKLEDEIGVIHPRVRKRKLLHDAILDKDKLIIHELPKIINIYLTPNEEFKLIINNWQYYKEKSIVDSIRIEFTIEYKRDPNIKEVIKDKITIYN